MSEPGGFCLGCRAVLDAEQGCECGGEARHVRLALSAADVIEEAMLVTPKIDRADLTSRAMVGTAAVLGPIALAFFGLYAAIHVTLPHLTSYWPWYLGAPYLLIAIAWFVFLAWSAREERTPYHAATTRARPGAQPGEQARLEAGELVAAEIHQRRDPSKVVVRDARVVEALVLRRPGERITVPVGRVDLVLPESRWRTGPSPLTRTWSLLPRAIFQAGVLRKAALRRGELISLVGGELAPAGHDEASFRRAAEKHLRWVPSNGRSRIVVMVDEHAAI